MSTNTDVESVLVKATSQNLPSKVDNKIESNKDENIIIKFFKKYKVEFSSFVACFTGISIVAYIHFECSSTYYTSFSTGYGSMHESHLHSTPPFLVISFGAASILLYGSIEAPLAQPRNAFFGQIISAICGVTIKQIFYYSINRYYDKLLWLQSALAVSTALLCMQLTGTVHPPGGATALFAVVGGTATYNLGYWFVLSPVGVGTAILLAVAIVVNKYIFGRNYPVYWWTKG